jgi:organic hydroperoxide reductase OsmC/OhrA
VTDPPTTEVRLAAAPPFRGDPGLLDPEQLLVLAAASCQLLAFLAVAARARLDVVAYEDHAEGTMPMDERRPWVKRIVLRPFIVLAVDEAVAADPPDALVARIIRLVEVAHRECYIANSLRSDIVVEPTLAFAAAAP